MTPIVNPVTGEVIEGSAADVEAALPLRVPQPMEFWGDYLAAPALETVAADLIASIPDLQWLQKYRLRLLWKKKATKSGGKIHLGKCQKASGLVEFFGEVDFVIWAAADMARGRPARWIEALVHHELQHCGYDEIEGDEGDEPEIVLKVKGHDFEGFTCELERYGAWTNDLAAAVPAFRQLPLLESRAAWPRTQR